MLYKLDDTDYEILSLLQRDARMSNSAIAKELDVAHTTVSRRIDALEKVGLIEGYRAVLNRMELGLGETVFVMVQLDTHSNASIEAFEDAIRDNFPNVIEVSKISGSWDYLLRIVARSLSHCEEIHRSIGEMEQISRLRTHAVFSTSDRPLPLPKSAE